VAAPSALLDGRAQLVLPGLQPHLGGLDCRLRLNQKIGWLFAFKNAAGVCPHLAKALTEINAHSSKAPLPAPQGCSKTSWVAQSEPRPNYRRLSRYDVIGLIWLLHGLAGRSSPLPPTVR
jgi:hypothetical protein